MSAGITTHDEAQPQSIRRSSRAVACFSDPIRVQYPRQTRTLCRHICTSQCVGSFVALPSFSSRHSRIHCGLHESGHNLVSGIQITSLMELPVPSPSRNGML
ncbi:hypothetical protein IF1G_00159 [Cordyceps javanica]|uniref:Uncharacterized protein n=1 Tax=Cordyceps javanica TaxID=43265 RepID=A0A545VER9_9HYPO|nr:hypothetical protein IF1G_00159 [Cordyceps javanica]